MPAILAAIAIAVVGALSFGAAGKRLRPRRSRTWFRLLNRNSRESKPSEGGGQGSA